MGIARIGGWIASTAAAIFLAGGISVSIAQNSTPSAPSGNQTNSSSATQSSSGCTYQGNSATATGGTGQGTTRHLDEGQTVTNYASRVTYVCRNGRLVRQNQ